MASLARLGQLTSLNLSGCEKLTEGTGEAEAEEAEEEEEEGQEDIQPLQNLDQLAYLNLSCCSWLTGAFRRS